MGVYTKFLEFFKAWQFCIFVHFCANANLNTFVLQESAQEKFKRKFAENPFVPIGCLLTAAALTYGLYSFKSGRRQMSQTMMRARIGAQGFTVLSILVGIGYNASKS